MKNEGRFSKLRRSLGLRRVPPEELAFAAGAWLAAPVVEASLAALGLQRTLRWVEAVPSGRPALSAVSPLVGERLVRAAYRRHLLRGSCLPQSIVQYLVHRRRGDSVRLVIGVRRPSAGPRSPGGASASHTPPLEAHAWVEAVDDAGGSPTSPAESPARDGFLPLAGGGTS